MRLAFARPVAVFVCTLAVVCAPVRAAAETAQILAAQDNTLYEDGGGTVSNGSGQWFFAGAIAFDPYVLRRAVIRFDVAGAIPAGALVTSATLTLYMDRESAISPLPFDATLHRALASWGEGASDGEDPEGLGAPSERDDATWIHRFYDGTFWAQAGGDYDPEASATARVGGGQGFYSWTGAGLAADVQFWLDSPSDNYGWMLRGSEPDAGSAKRYVSRHNPLTDRHPRLTVEYTLGGGGAGAVPEHPGQGVPLRVAKTPGGNLALEWGVSCLASDTDYEVYEGTLAAPFADHEPLLCSTGGAMSAVVLPLKNSGFYLAVPRNAAAEGSYGTRTPGVQRDPSAAACVPQSRTPCL